MFCNSFVSETETNRQVRGDVCKVGPGVGAPVPGGSWERLFVPVQCGAHLWNDCAALPAAKARRELRRSHRQEQVHPQPSPPLDGGRRRG